MMTVNYIALAIPAFFLLIGVELFVAWRQSREVYRFNDAVTDLGCGIGQQAVGILLKGALFAGYVVVFEGFRLIEFAPGSLVPWLVAFLGVDLAYYWWHRLSHEVSFMWAIHVVHHQSEDYNLAVALRQAWFSGLSSWVFYLPMAFLGVPPAVFATIAAFSTLYQFWIHTRIIGKLGPLEWVINTPSHHRVHHGRNPKYLDRNYAATLIVWDRLFGSFQEEEEEPLYGTVEAYGSWNSVWANFDFWKHLADKARRADRPVDKLKVWFMPPGWTPPGAEPHVEADVASESPIRFRTESSRAVNLYVLAQFAVVTAATTALLFWADALTLAEQAGGVALILAGTLVWGGLFEAKRWAVPAELVRLAVIAAAAAVYGVTDGLGPAVAATAVLSSLGFGVWIALTRRALTVRTDRVAAEATAS